MGSRDGVGLEGVGDAGVSRFNDVSGGCASEKKDKYSIFVFLYDYIVIKICKNDNLTYHMLKKVELV